MILWLSQFQACAPKFNPPKNPMPNFVGSHKNFQKALNDVIQKIETLVLNTQKNPYLNKAPQKVFAKIFLLKKIPKLQISNTNSSFNHPCHLKSRGTHSN